MRLQSQTGIALIYLKVVHDDQRSFIFGKTFFFPIEAHF